ncbi:MAG: hypothetical protein SO314_01650 [Alphaproteobacteria bacterium]|nr:hypothetical protein [Alphaproteobacteria bacterium]
MFDNNNSDNGQRRLRFNFGKKFKRKPYNHELSYQENMMNLFNDYRQWQQDHPQPDCSNMSTREVLEAIVSDFRAQQREEEEAKKAAQMQAPYGSAQTSYVPTQGSYGMQQNANMSPQRSYVPAGQVTYGETETIGAAHQDIDRTQESGWQNIVRNADYMSTAARQGLSYGWSDELEGVMGGVGYALGSLVPSWNKNNESMTEAFKRGYITHRDEERQRLEQARQNAPVLTTVSEAVGAIASPIGAAKLPNAPYINAIKKTPLKKATSYGSFYGTGTAENKDTFGETLGNYAENIGTSMFGNMAGNHFGEKIFGRAAFPITRNFVEQGVGTVTEKIYNSLYKNRYNSK